MIHCLARHLSTQIVGADAKVRGVNKGVAISIRSNSIGSGIMTVGSRDGKIGGVSLGFTFGFTLVNSVSARNGNISGVNTRGGFESSVGIRISVSVGMAVVTVVVGVEVLGVSLGLGGGVGSGDKCENNL